MRVILNNTLYDWVSRLSRYFVPIAGTIYILASYVAGVCPRVSVLASVVFLQAILGTILLTARTKWRPKDTFIIDDRDPHAMTFGFESGRRLQELKHGKIMTLRIRKIASEVRDDFGAYSDHQ